LSKFGEKVLAERDGGVRLWEGSTADYSGRKEPKPRRGTRGKQANYLEKEGRKNDPCKATRDEGF